MFSGSSLTLDKFAVGGINKYVGSFNESQRSRSALETGIRTATYLHPTAMYTNTASELGEAVVHLGAKRQTSFNRTLLEYAKSKDAAKDVIFDRSVNPMP